jgi:HlyD family secretion protein
MPRSRKIKASAPRMMTPTSLTGWKSKSAVLGAVAVALGLAVLAATTGEQESTRAGRPEPADGKRWQTVAPGRVEPVSGTIKIAAPAMGVLAQVLVKVDDKVFAGEPLVRLVDTEARARLAAAEAQVAFRLRARNEESAPAASPPARPARPAPPVPRRRGEVAAVNPDKAAARRRAEDAVADADKAVMEAQAALDKAVVDRRSGAGSTTAVEAARAALARARERQQQQKVELRRIEADPGTPLPTFAEGQVNVARAEAAAAAAEIERLTIRAPIAGTVLQVNAKPGELAAPSNAQPLLVIGDVSALRVRAELDERDLGEIKIGQPAVIRADAFRGRDFAGKVSFIAPIVEPARINSARGQRNVTDVDVVEVLVDLAQPDPLAVGMKVDVYFQPGGR